MPDCTGMDSDAAYGQLARENTNIVLLLIASPPVLVAILPGLGGGEDLRPRIENRAGAIRVPIAGPRILLVLEQTIKAIGNLIGQTRVFAQHHVPHHFERLAIRVSRASLLHPG